MAQSEHKVHRDASRRGTATNLRKDDLVAAVARLMKVPKKKASTAVDVTLKTIRSSLKEGNVVRVGGMGLTMLQLKSGRKVINLAAEPNIDRVAKRVARQTALEKSAFELDARARAILRGVKMREHDLRAAGGAFDFAELKKLLGISRQAVDKRVRSGSLLRSQDRETAHDIQLFSLIQTVRWSMAFGTCQPPSPIEIHGCS